MFLSLFGTSLCLLASLTMLSRRHSELCFSPHSRTIPHQYIRANKLVSQFFDIVATFTSVSSSKIEGLGLHPECNGHIALTVGLTNT